MTLRKPLVIVSGEVQEIAAADTLDRTYWTRTGTLLNPETATDDVEFNAFRYVNATTGGNSNTFAGVGIGATNSGSNNSGFGYQVFLDATSANNNSAFGYRSLYNLTTGDYNTSFGSEALYTLTTKNDNVAVGYRCLRVNNGQANFAMGTQSMLKNTSGNFNMAIGDRVLWSNVTGSNNAAIGYQAGYFNLGSANVFIGNRAGRDQTGSNFLYIHNNESATPLIYGEFINKLLKINGEFQTSEARNVSITRVTSATYTVLNTDHIIFANTDLNAITITLLPGVLGSSLRIINTGSGSNLLTITPSGAEKLIGENSNYYRKSSEALIIEYETTDGWF